MHFIDKVIIMEPYSIMKENCAYKEQSEQLLPELLHFWLNVNFPSCVSGSSVSGDLLLLIRGGGDGSIRIHHRLGTSHHYHQQEKAKNEEEEESEAQVHVHLSGPHWQRSLVHLARG